MGFLDTLLGKTWKRDDSTDRKPVATFDPYASTDFSRSSDNPNTVRPARSEEKPRVSGFDPYAVDNFMTGATSKPTSAPAQQPAQHWNEPTDFVSPWGYTPPNRVEWGGPTPNTSGYESAYSPNTFTPLANPDQGTAWWDDGAKLENPDINDGQFGLVGANTVNERYAAMAREHGISDEDINDWFSGYGDWGNMLDAPTTAGDGGPNAYWDGGNYGAPDPAYQSGIVRPEVDDGTSWDYEHLTSPYMTGRQYREYVNQGLGGLPPEQIDDDAIYNKYDEMVENGFQPFTPTYAVALRGGVQQASEMPFRAGTSISHAREAIGKGYKIRKDGVEIDGRTFDREAPAYISQISSGDWSQPPDSGEPYTTFVTEWRVPGEHGGQDGYHYGQWYADPYTQTIEFEDGTSVHLSTAEWTRICGGPGYDGEGLSYRLTDVNQTAYEVDPSQFDQSQVRYIPDFVMSDGTRLNYQQANSIYFDRDPNDSDEDGISYESHIWQPLPSRLLSSEPVMDASETTDEDGPRVPEWVQNVPFVGPWLSDTRINRNWNPWNIVDWTLGSVPIMLGAPSWLYSASAASPARYGFDTSTYDPVTHTYNYLSGGYDDDGNLVFGAYVPNPNYDPDDPESDEPPYIIDPQYTEELRAMNILGNITVPATEMLAGNVGPQFLRGRWGDALPASATRGQAALHHLRGTGAEAAEEIVGNPFEELSRYGISGFYADPMRDGEGNVMYDPMGHEVRDLTTSPNARWANAWNAADLLNAAAGGAGVSMLLGLLGGNVSDTLHRPTRRQVEQRQATAEGATPVSPEGTDSAESHLRPSVQPVHPNELDAYQRYLEQRYGEQAEQ